MKSFLLKLILYAGLASTDDKFLYLSATRDDKGKLELIGWFSYMSDKYNNRIPDEASVNLWLSSQSTYLAIATNNCKVGKQPNCSFHNTIDDSKYRT